MGRSSRLVGMLTAGLAALCSPPANAAPLHGSPAMARPSVTTMQTVPQTTSMRLGGMPRPQLQSLRSQGVQFRGLRFRGLPVPRGGLGFPRGFRSFGLGGVDLAAGLAAPPYPAAPYYLEPTGGLIDAMIPAYTIYDRPPPEPEPPYFDPPRPCVRPLIIKIGRGIRQKARTRVVYGGPPVCVRGY